jgi:hypothetical protein
LPVEAPDVTQDVSRKRWRSTFKFSKFVLYFYKNFFIERRFSFLFWSTRTFPWTGRYLVLPFTVKEVSWAWACSETETETMHMNMNMNMQRVEKGNNAMNCEWSKSNRSDTLGTGCLLPLWLFIDIIDIIDISRCTL